MTDARTAPRDRATIVLRRVVAEALEPRRLLADVSAVLMPVADATVDNDAPVANFGADPTLSVHFSYGENADHRIRSYLQFDVGQFVNNDPVDDPSQVNRATLTLYGESDTPHEADTHSVYAYATDDSTWGESTITWDNQPLGPAIAGPAYDVATVTAPGPNVLTWDVTAIVKDELSRPNADGLVTVVLADETTPWYAQFARLFSSENTGTIPGVAEPRPTLTVEGVDTGDLTLSRQGVAADAYVDAAETNPPRNHGAAQTLFAHHAPFYGEAVERWVVLGYDLSNLTLDDADLVKVRLYGSLSDDSVDFIQFAAYGSESDPGVDWTEGGVNWANRPMPSTDVLLDTMVVGTTERWYEWDVTDFARERLLDNKQDMTIVLRNSPVVPGGPNTTDPTATGSFHSRERDGGAHGPELLVGSDNGGGGGGGGGGGTTLAPVDDLRAFDFDGDDHPDDGDDFRVELSWDDRSTGEDGHIITRTKMKGSGSAVVPDPGDTINLVLVGEDVTSWRDDHPDNPLEAGETYRYTVEPYDGDPPARTFGGPADVDLTIAGPNGTAAVDLDVFLDDGSGAHDNSNAAEAAEDTTATELPDAADGAPLKLALLGTFTTVPDGQVNIGNDFGLQFDYADDEIALYRDAAGNDPLPPRTEIDPGSLAVDTAGNRIVYAASRQEGDLPGGLAVTRGNGAQRFVAFMGGIKKEGDDDSNPDNPGASGGGYEDADGTESFTDRDRYWPGGVGRNTSGNQEEFRDNSAWRTRGAKTLIIGFAGHGQGLTNDNGLGRIWDVGLEAGVSRIAKYLDEKINGGPKAGEPGYEDKNLNAIITLFPENPGASAFSDLSRDADGALGYENRTLPPGSLAYRTGGALSFAINAVNFGGIEEIAVFGFSHGGGTAEVFADFLAAYVNTNVGQAPNAAFPSRFLNQFGQFQMRETFQTKFAAGGGGNDGSLFWTGYIDAVDLNWDIDTSDDAAARTGNNGRLVDAGGNPWPFAEEEPPENTKWHFNAFQDGWLNGDDIDEDSHFLSNQALNRGGNPVADDRFRFTIADGANTLILDEYFADGEAPDEKPIGRWPDGASQVGARGISILTDTGELLLRSLKDAGEEDNIPWAFNVVDIPLDT